jgi:hypothetical protein
MKRLSVLLFLLLVASASAQNKSGQDFVLDQSKPYVYLKFDHIGPRKPLQGEGNTGLWLRVVNNCSIPIVFESYNVDDDEPGVGLADEVVETEPILQIFSQEEEKETQRREKLRKSKLKHKPKGYSLEIYGTVRVQPGTDILFSVPLNHVDADDDWYMRVKFALDLDKSSIVAGPFTYLPFHEYDIPKELRPADQ